MFSFKVDTAQWDTDDPEHPGLDSHCRSMAFLFIACFVERFLYWFICFKADNHCSCWTWVHSGCFQHISDGNRKKRGKKSSRVNRLEAKAGFNARLPHYHQFDSLSGSVEAAIRGNDKSLTNLVEHPHWHMATLPGTPPRNHDDHIFNLSLEPGAVNLTTLRKSVMETLFF